jgi:hypothetical protein
VFVAEIFAVEFAGHGTARFQVRDGHALVVPARKHGAAQSREERGRRR